MKMNTDHISPCVNCFLLLSIYFSRVKKVKKNPYPLYPFHTPDFEMMMNTDLDTSACVIFFLLFSIYFFRGKEGKGKPLPPLPFSQFRF